MTDLGTELATSLNTSAALEQALTEIVFCREPWFPPSRVEQYDEFEVHPFPVTREIMTACDGWIDRDEYDLFVSRVRRERETRWAVEGIGEFRQLSGDQRESLLAEVRSRIPSPKTYGNWRDLALHTFSLFGSSASMVRSRDRLLLTNAVVERQPARRAGRRRVAPRAAQLTLPEPPANLELSSPPATPAVNPGTDGELLVGKLLEADGWHVVYYSTRRGFGFDLWARRGDRVMLVEVKSGIESVGSITLTDLEYQAARRYRRNYVLAVVENLREGAPSVAFIQDPATSLAIRAATVREYRIARADWLAVATPADLSRPAPS